MSVDLSLVDWYIYTDKECVEAAKYGGFGVRRHVTKEISLEE